MRRLNLLGIALIGAFSLTAEELPITWQGFHSDAATKGVPAAETLTIATVAFDSNVPVDGQALNIHDRAKTNLLRVAEIVRQVKVACKAKGGIYAEAPILVCFPEETVTGIVEVDKEGRRGFDRYRGGAFGTIDEVPLKDWIAYLGPKPFPEDAVTRRLRDIAVSENVYISCGYDVRNPDGRTRYRNVCTLFGPEKSQFIDDDDGYGIIGYHYKAHPVGAEREYVQRGEEFKVWPTKVGKIGMLICYDLFFPESARIPGIGGADIVIAATGWPRAYATAYPGGVTVEGRKNDGPGINPDGLDDRSLTYIDMSIRVASFRNGFYFVTSNLANPGALGHSTIVYPTGRTMCVSRGDARTEAEGYLPGIAIANIGKASKAHEIAVSENTGFDFMSDRNPPAYRPIAE